MSGLSTSGVRPLIGRRRAHRPCSGTALPTRDAAVARQVLAADLALLAQLDAQVTELARPKPSWLELPAEGGLTTSLHNTGRRCHAQSHEGRDQTA
jgi:hypothetical protein